MSFIKKYNYLGNDGRGGITRSQINIENNILFLYAIYLDYGNNNTILLKTDINGNIIWSKKININGYGFIHSKAFVFTNNSIYLNLHKNNQIELTGTILIIKYSINGDFIHAKTIETTYGSVPFLYVFRINNKIYFARGRNITIYNTLNDTFDSFNVANSTGYYFDNFSNYYVHENQIITISDNENLTGYLRRFDEDLNLIEEFQIKLLFPDAKEIVFNGVSFSYDSYGNRHYYISFQRYQNLVVGGHEFHIALVTIKTDSTIVSKAIKIIDCFGNDILFSENKLYVNVRGHNYENSMLILNSDLSQISSKYLPNNVQWFDYNRAKKIFTFSCSVDKILMMMSHGNFEFCISRNVSAPSFQSFPTTINNSNITSIVKNNNNLTVNNINITSELFTLNEEVICLPTIFSSLQLESHNIPTKDFIINQPISISGSVGNIIISNTGTASATILTGTEIATINGITYQTGTTNKEIVAGATNVPIQIYVSGTPKQLGPFAPEIIISSPYVDNTTDHLKIPFNVIASSPDLQVSSHNIEVKNFELGQSGGPVYVGNIVIYNAGTAVGEMMPGLTVVNAHGVIYRTESTPNPISISPGNSASIKVYTSASNPSPVGQYSESISISNSKPVTNPKNLEIKFNIIDESFKVEVLNDLVINEAFIKDLPLQGTPTVGFLQMRNKTTTKNFIIEAGTVIHDVDAAYGLTFQVKNKVELPANQPETQYTSVEVVVASNGGASQVGNGLSVPIAIPLVNTNGHRIIFNVAEDILNVEVTDNLVINYVFDQVEPLTNNIEVGYLRLENKSKVKEITIPDGVRIHLEEQVNGLVFVTGEQKRITAGEKDVYIKIVALKDHSAIHYGPQSYPVGLPIDGVNNPNGYKILFNVKQEPIKARVTGAPASDTFIKGIPPSLDRPFGNISIQNDTKTRALEIFAGDLFTLNGFTFSIPERADGSNYSIPALSGGYVPVWVRSTNTMQSVVGCNNEWAITIPSVQNTNPQYKVNFCVEDEPLNVRITKYTPEAGGNVYIQGLATGRNYFPGGKVEITNFTETRDLSLIGRYFIGEMDGLNFYLSAGRTIIKHGGKVELDIIVRSESGATALGDWQFPLDLLFLGITPDTFSIPFKVIEDTLNVELTHAEFYLSGLRKGEAIPEAISRRVGSITLENKSLVKDFTLYMQTPIHSSPNINGLIFRTSNTTEIPIYKGDSVTIDIELHPSQVTPIELGHYPEAVYIKDVRNPGDSGPDAFFIELDVFGNGTNVGTSASTSLQSPHFSLMAAGSKGTDSPKGNQLRWIFSGNLGEKHLPKGTLETNHFNYNKPNDYVNTYRAPYIEKLSTKFALDLSTSPSMLDDGQRCWIYKVDGVSTEDDIPAKFPTNQRILYVYFRNRDLYDTLRASRDPFRDAEGFIMAYGENIIEIESKDELFFKVAVSTNKYNEGDIYMEILSTEENKLVTSKYLSFRKKMTPRELRSTRFFAENGKSVRFKKQGDPIFVLEFEFYSDFIASASHWMAWEAMGNYGLTLNDRSISSRLGSIDGKWLRYNEKEYVRKQNYIDKWRFVPTADNDMRMGIRQVVDKYIELSNKANNPRAEDHVDFNFSNPDDDYTPEPPTEENGGTLVSYLDLLNVAAVDYHVARLLGLGTLDMDPEVLAGKEYIYMTEYKTLKDPKDENTYLVYPCQLLSMSLPTSINTERLPLAVEISELYKGIPKQQNEDIPVLYDAEGYTYDGKSRFVSIINKPVPSAERNPSFFPNEAYWDASLYTLPVYAGLEYRIASRIIRPATSGQAPEMGAVPAIPSDPSTKWRRPELSHDTNYRNLDADGVVSGFETVPIMLPETFGDPLYVHRQTASGTYHYATYGINIFSRATTSLLSSNIATTIKPKNTLLPPSEIKTWLIQPERPLMFTSEFEQEKYDELVKAEVEDKTFVRVNFSYDATQDMVTHPLPLDSGVEDDEYIQNTDEYFPDEYDVFADDIEVYFRKDTPRKISAGLSKVEPDNDRLCAVFRTRPYQLASTGETLYPVLPEGTAFKNFIGSVFLVNDRSYVIKSVSSDTKGLVFTVYREEVSRTILAGGSIAVDFNTLSTPETSGNDLFVVMENMQSPDAWGRSISNAFKIQLEFPEVHREIITKTSEGGSVQKYLEKSRGLWIDADITKFEEGGVHKGIYKVTIPDIGLGTPLPLDAAGNAFYEKNNGSVRVFRNRNISGDIFTDPRDVFKVIRTEPFGRYVNLYIYDSEFKFDKDGNPSGNLHIDEIQTESVKINYYPSYFLYLYRDDMNGLNQEAVLPTGDDIVKYSIFGLRSVDKDFDLNGNLYRSKFSAPSLMAGQRIVAPEQPERPNGSLYATRPDFYGKATYSFTTRFTQRPYGVQFCRTDNNALLNALYEQKTIKDILTGLAEVGGNDEEFLANRWENFFDYEHLGSKDGTGVYKTYPEQPDVPGDNGKASIAPVRVVKIEASQGDESGPETGGEGPAMAGYAFPLPDKEEFFKSINEFIDDHEENTGQSIKPIKNDGSVKLNDVIIKEVEGVNKEFKLIDFVREVIDNSFVPLTEVPVIYQHVKKHPYLPINKKQTIRDNAGYLLSTSSDDFDMAPMMTILNDKENITLFTDFTLAGTTGNLYFYASREIGSQMTMGELSMPLGPVKTVDSNPLEAPKILSGLPVLENKVLGIKPKIKVEVHSYSDIHRVGRINLYRTDNRSDAASILSMQLVKQLEVLEVELSENNTWTISDDLEGFEHIPFGDTLFYRVTVDKQIQYADPHVNNDGTQNIIKDHAPSQTSKILALMLRETSNPDSPELSVAKDPDINGEVVENVVFRWEQTCYKGKYHFYKMGEKGNWQELARLEIGGQDMSTAYISLFEGGSWQEREKTSLVDNGIELPLRLIGLDILKLYDDSGERIFHHFKVVAENTSQMFSTEERTLTVYKGELDDGISGDGLEGMEIGRTFIIR